MQITSPPTQFDNPVLDAWLRELHSALVTTMTNMTLQLAEVPTSSTDTGVRGMIAMDADYVYFCYAADSWKRISYRTLWGATGIF
jgi:hypothetical protein